MSVALAVALLALLVALFALVALVAVYAASARSRRAARPSCRLPSLVGRPAPVAVRPRPVSGRVVAVLDGDCALCRAVWQDGRGAPQGRGDRRRPVRRAGRPRGRRTRPGGSAELVVDVEPRADLFEGYAPTVLTVGAAGTVTGRRFVYPDTDLPALLRRPDLRGER